MSELAGRSTLALKAEELGLSLHSDALDEVLTTLKSLEHQGLPFRGGRRLSGAACCVGRRGGGLTTSTSRRSGSSRTTTAGSSRTTTAAVISDHDDRAMTEATVKVRVSGERVVATAEGNGPVNALDSALRQAIGRYYPSLAHIHLIDYRVRVLDTNLGTGAVTRVLIDTTDGEVTWTTIGVSENIIEASWQALYDSIVYGLLHSVAGAHPGTGPVEETHDPTQLRAGAESRQVRPSMRLKTPEDWRADRVAELRGPTHPQGTAFGFPGPDQGYALKLGQDLFADRLELVAGETRHDVVYGGAMVASARASLFGRAPVGPDLEIALTLFGYLGGAPEDLVEWRVPRFQSVSHHYEEQRRLVGAVHETTLRMTVATIRERLGQWRELVERERLSGSRAERRCSHGITASSRSQHGFTFGGLTLGPT